MAYSDWSTTASSNTSIGAVSIAEGMSPANVNNAIREMMAQLATASLIGTSEIGTSVQAYSAILEATTAAFTTEQETKLQGIETGADVTDTDNVTAAGATMDADTSIVSKSWASDDSNFLNDPNKAPTRSAVKSFVDTSGGPISETTLSADSNWTTTFNSSLRNGYRVVFANVKSSFDNDILRLRTSSDGGSSYDSGASDYRWVRKGRRSTGASANAEDGADSFIQLADGVGASSSDGGVSGEVVILRPDLVARTRAGIDLYWDFEGGGLEDADGAGQRQEEAAVDAIEVSFATGNLASGYIAVYAVPATITVSTDTTAPVLTGPTASANGQNASTNSVTTDEDNGTLYWVIDQSSTAPSAAQIKLGNDQGDAAADDSGSVAVSATGAINIAGSGLTAGTTYYTYFMHEDAAGNQSNVASASAFMTASGSAPVISSSDPADNDTNHPVADSIVVNFDKPVRFTGNGGIVLRTNNGGWQNDETFDGTGTPPAQTGPLSVTVGAVGTSGSFQAGDETISWDFTGGGWTEFSGQTYTSAVNESDYGGSSASQVIYRNCTFENITGDGFKFGQNVSDIWVIGCTFSNVSASAISGRSSSGSTRVHIIGCTIDGCGEDGISAGDVTSGADHVGFVAVGNDINDTGTDGPSGLYHSIYVQCPDYKVIGNHIRGNRDDAAISCRSSGIVTDNLCDGTPQWTTTRGIRYFADHPAGPSDTWTVKRNHVENCDDPVFISNPPGQYQGDSGHLIDDFVIQDNTADQAAVLIEDSYWSGGGHSNYTLSASNNVQATGTEVGTGNGEISIVGEVLTINPTSSLVSAREYAVRIDSTAIEDLDGNTFAGIANDTTLSFTTA